MENTTPAPSFELETIMRHKLVKKKVDENIVMKLRKQQIHGIKPGARWCHNRNLTQSLFPNLTVGKADKVPGYIKKFTPDGMHLIAFSVDQTSVEIYEYQGIQSANELLSDAHGDFINSHNSSDLYDKTRDKLFSSLFRLKHRVLVMCDRKLVNRDFLLLTEDSRYAVISTQQPASRDYIRSSWWSNNESITPSTQLEDYNILCIDILGGVKTSSIEFNCNKILSSRSQGIFLLKDTVAILSTQHQIIYIYKLVDGKFYKTHKIDRFACEEDEMSFNNVYSKTTDSDIVSEKPYCILKQKLLLTLYKKSVRLGNKGLSKFYAHYKLLEGLKMWKIQLINEDILLVKYVTLECIFSRTTPDHASNSPAFFVFYDFNSEEIVSVYENVSQKMVDLYETCPQIFFGGEFSRGNLQSASFDIHSKHHFNRYKLSVRRSRCGGEMESKRRMLNQLPLHCQVLCPSPYLDVSLFSYDDKFINSVERSKSPCEYPIRFYSRKSGLLRFQLQTDRISHHRTRTGIHRNYVSYIFHPTEPLALSVKRNQDNHVFNLHIRNVPSVVS